MTQHACHLFATFVPKRFVVVNAGRNNTVLQGEFGPSRENVVVKRYPEDRSERFRREVAFLRFCEKSGISAVPGLVESCLEHLVIVLKHCAGERPEAFSEDHETQIVEFLVTLQQEPRQDTDIPEASEAAWNVEDFKKSLFWRSNTLQAPIQRAKVRANSGNSSEVFDEYLMSGLFREDLAWLGHAIDETCSTPRSELYFVSPSDLGAHNCLEDNGRLIFLDFEYAGTDSGINLAGDLAMQPDSIWASGDRHRIGQRIVREVFESRSYESDRVERLFGTRWSLIVLRRHILASNPKNNEDNQMREVPPPPFVTELAGLIAGRL